MVRETTNKLKNGRPAVTSAIRPEIVKAAEEEGIDMITDLVNRL